MNRLILPLAVAALLLGCVGRARADLIVNGGFETGDFTGWMVSNTSPSNTFVTPYYSNGDPEDNYFPQSGNYLAVFGNAGSLGTISQTVADTAGQQYILNMYLESNGTTPNEYQVQWNGATLYDQTNIPSQPWNLLSFTVVGTGSDSLALNGSDDPNFLALDSVSLTSAVPEPATLSLLATALASGIILLQVQRKSGRRETQRS